MSKDKIISKNISTPNGDYCVYYLQHTQFWGISLRFCWGTLSHLTCLDQLFHTNIMGSESGKYHQVILLYML